MEAARRAEVASPLEALAGDEHLRRRLAAVLGASSALGDHLVAHPDQWRCLAEPGDPPAHGDVTDVAALRMSYRRSLLRIAADDLTGVRDVEETMATLSALADATLAAAYRLAVGGRPGHLASPWWRWASAAAASSTTSPTST